MRLSVCMGRGLRVLFVLAMTFALAGCLSTRTTRIAETDAAIAGQVCQAWRVVTYSSRDTEQTQREAAANNAARAAYCGG